jgi:hypothetical protein
MIQPLDRQECLDRPESPVVRGYRDPVRRAIHRANCLQSANFARNRAAACGPGGRGFESRRSPSLRSPACRGVSSCSRPSEIAAKWVPVQALVPLFGDIAVDGRRFARIRAVAAGRCRRTSHPSVTSWVRCKKSARSEMAICRAFRGACSRSSRGGLPWITGDCRGSRHSRRSSASARAPSACGRAVALASPFSGTELAWPARLPAAHHRCGQAVSYRPGSCGWRRR